MEQLLTALIAGFVAGTINALLGAGLVAVYRGTRIINFAHGSMAMFSTYVFVTLVDHRAPTLLGFPLPAILTTVIFAIFLGVFIDIAVMRPLAKQSYLVKIIATLGVLYVLQSLALILFNAASTRSVKPIFNHGGYHLGQITVSYGDVGVAVTAFAIAIGLTAFYSYSRFGTAIRAVSNSREAASLVGIRVNWVTAASWAIGGATGALAGMLLAPSLALDSYTLTLLVIAGFAAALTGRLESIAMALVGGLGLGITASLVNTYVGEWSATHTVSFVNLSHVTVGVSLAWIVVLLLIWKKPATTQQQAGGLLL